MRKNKFIIRKQEATKNIILLLILIIGLGYAILQENLNITGASSLNNPTWNIHWANVQVASGSVSASTPTISNQTTVIYSVTLNNPGDYYEFTVDAVNEGTLDAMIETINSKLNGATITTLPDYLEYIVSYEDGVELATNHLLAANTTETYKVRIKYRDDINVNQIPTTNQTLSLEFTVKYKQADDTAIEVVHPYLYNILKDAAIEGTYAKEYTGSHQDSMAGVGTKKIYHWYAPTDTAGDTLANEILDKNNVIFANHCWQMIRTTDTGGVKMIYNGEPENNQCLNTRGNHVGYAERAVQIMSTTYYYGTSYTYDSTNNVFSLDGTITTGTIQTGQYTCRSTSSTGTCETLYLVDTLNSGTMYYVLPLIGNSHYSQFGTLQFNQNSKSPAYAGYMYNTIYLVTSKSQIYYIQDTYASIITNDYYSDTIDYGNQNAGNYTLTNPVLISTLSDYSTLVGKYVLSSSGTYADQAYYVIDVSGTTILAKKLIDGDLKTSLTVGDTYTESGGIYTLSGNVTNVPYITWYNTTDRSIYKGKYVCDGNNTSCTNLRHIRTDSNQSKNSYYYFDTNNKYSYSESVNYSGGTYTLTGDIKTFWDLFDSTNQGYLSTHHYTCLENGTSCSTVGYINYISGGTLYYVQLSNVADISTALTNMLSADNVNQINSTMKTGIDAWYKRYMTGYTSQLVDTIFCYDRSISSRGGWNPNGGGVSTSINYLRYKYYASNGDLSCSNTTDKFSMANTKATLTYPVGLLVRSETNLLNNANIKKTGQDYWEISFCYFNNSENYGYGISSSGGSLTSYNYKSNGVRPVVSLKPGTLYTSGSGSKSDPYIIE